MDCDSKRERIIPPPGVFWAGRWQSLGIHFKRWACGIGRISVMLFGLKRKKRHRSVKTSVAEKRSLRRLSLGKKRFFLGFFALLMLLVALAIIEGGLRLFGLGYSTRFFLEREINGRVSVLTENHRFFWSFFPKPLSRSPQPIQLTSQKPKNTKRIIIFGESAAMGDPEPAFGLARILKFMLERRHPDHNWEVVNLAVTAINSHVIVPMARETAARVNADFWCLYIGNNEVVAQFGPGTVFGTSQSNLRLIRASLAVKRTRIGQMANSFWEIVAARSKSEAEWTGMGMFTKHQVAADDPRLNGVYENFEANLNDIITAGLQGGAKVFVSSIAVNLRGSSPFRSTMPESLSNDSLAEWNRLFDKAQQLFKLGSYDASLEAAQAAMKIYADHAELHFLTARCLWHLQDYASARKRFLLARDLDALRFRTDSKLNKIIKRTAMTYSSKSVVFVDSESLFAFNAPNGIPGDELFWDHVHFRFPGNYLLGLAFARKIEGQLRSADKAGDLSPWPSLDDCSISLTLTRWSDYQMLQTMRRRLNQEPFLSQSVHAERDRRLAQQLMEHAVGVASDSFSIQQSAFERSLERNPNDFVLRDQYGKYLLSFGRRTDAVEQWRKVIEQVPYHLMSHFQIGQALAEDPTRAPEAEQALRQVLEIRAETADILITLGKSLITQRKYEKALGILKTGLYLRPTSIEGLIQAARAYAELQQRDQAMRHLEKAESLAPNDSSIASAMANLRSKMKAGQQ